MFKNRKTSKFWIVFVLSMALMLIVSACGGGAPEATEAPVATESPTSTPVAQGYIPVADEADGPIVISAGIIYSIVGAENVTSEILDNDIVRFVIDGEIVQGYARYPLSIYQGEHWAGTAKFDGINQSLEVLFNTTCTGAENVKLETSTNVTVTCKNDAREWKIQITLRVSVLSTTSIVPAASQVNVIEWQNLEEGKWYLFCPAPEQWYVKYTPENGPAKDFQGCFQAKVLNKLAYRIWSPSISESNGIATVYPETALGGYPFIAAKDLLIGRVYYVCPTDVSVLEGNKTQINECVEGVYLGNGPTGLADFNVNSNSKSYSLTGAFPSPRP